MTEPPSSSGRRASHSDGRDAHYVSPRSSHESTESRRRRYSKETCDKQERPSHRQGNGSRKNKESKSFQEVSGEPGFSSQSSATTSEELEMDKWDSEDEDESQDDEETGLRQKQRRRRRRRESSPNGDAEREEADQSKKKERKLADLKVLKSSIVNVLLICSWYLFSLSISIYNKWMFSAEHLGFHFPLFTTSLHMVVQFTLASLVLYFIPQLRPRHSATSPEAPVSFEDSEPLDPPPQTKRNPLMTPFFFATRIAPCGIATGLDIGLGNTSLKFITLTFFTMCKSSALVFVLLFAFLFRLELPSIKLILIIATMTIGVVMMVAGETAFNQVGFMLIISSAFFSGFRWALTQILLLHNPATSNPFSSIFFLAPVMFCTLAVLAIPVEGFAALGGGLQALTADKGNVVGVLLLLFPGVLAFCMTASEFALLQRTSVVTLSICGIFKEVVTISAAGIVFQDPLTPINVSGLLVTILSIAAYNYIKIVKMRKDAREKVREREIGKQVDGSADIDEGMQSNVFDGSRQRDSDDLETGRRSTSALIGDAVRSSLVIDTNALLSGQERELKGKSSPVKRDAALE
ncbi:Triose-phosphate Transporter [Agyrium rufum]|nr:Triose-phosphate Transporter [Agyrium rufum]